MLHLIRLSKKEERRKIFFVVVILSRSFFWSLLSRLKEEKEPDLRLEYSSSRLYGSPPSGSHKIRYDVGFYFTIYCWWCCGQEKQRPKNERVNYSRSFGRSVGNIYTNGYSTHKQMLLTNNWIVKMTRFQKSVENFSILTPPFGTQTK